MKSTTLMLMTMLAVQSCVSASAAEPAAGPMEVAIQRAWAKVAGLETNQPALSGFSKTRPTFNRDGRGLVKAELNFAFNSTPYGKDRNPSAADQSKPFCYLIVSVWRPNNLPGQPVATQRTFQVGTEELQGYVTVFCNDDRLATEIRTIFETEMQKAEGKKTSEPTVRGDGKPAPQP